MYNLIEKRPNNYQPNGETFFDNLYYCKVGKVMDLRNQRSYISKEYYKKPTDQQKNSFCLEISLLKSCNSDYILKYHDSFYTENYRVLLVEECSNAPLSKILEESFANKRPAFSENQALHIIGQLICGFIDLHKVGGMHKSFTPLSVVKQGEIYKIFDLGAIKTHIFEGIYDRYIPPEVRKDDDNKFDSRVDVWSLGMMLFEMVAGKEYEESMGTKQIDKLDNISSESKDLLKAMLNLDFRLRPLWKDIQDFFKITGSEVKIYNLFYQGSSIHASIHGSLEDYNTEAMVMHNEEMTRMQSQLESTGIYDEMTQ